MADTVEPESDFCLEAVSYWCEHGEEKRRKGNEDILSKAKKSLFAKGWTSFCTEKGRLRYASPSGMNYSSLRTACEAFLDDLYRCETKTPKRRKNRCETKTPKRRKKDDLLHSHGVAQDKSVNIVEQPKSEETKKTRDDQKQTLPCSSRAVTLPWLINNNAVSESAKVHYLGSKGPLAEGRIDHGGIKCDCCGNLFTLSGFEAHAGSKKHRPAANIFLEDGRSLLDCQRGIVGNHKVILSTKDQDDRDAIKGNVVRGESDRICSFCYCGGELILCEKCPSAFHKTCLGLKDVPRGDWSCPSCCCRICGKRKYEENGQHSNGDDISRICEQCQHRFHLGCLRKSRGIVKLKDHTRNIWYCSDNCQLVSSCLHKILEKPLAIGTDNLTWRLLKSREGDQQNLSDSHEMEALMKNQSKLNVALGVMHECFEPVREAFTGRDLVEDVIFNRGSNLNRLNFKGFFTVLLEKNEEVISVANIRVYDNVAEMPFIATRFQHRKHGMCRLLLNETESLLHILGVRRLIVPAVPEVLNTWTTKFGFSKMSDSEKLQYLNYTFLSFQDTIMCQKPLMQIPSAKLLPWKQ